MTDAVSNVPDHDRLLQATCEMIVTTAAQAIDAEPEGKVLALKLPDGAVVGKQILMDVSEGEGKMNVCRLSVLNSDVAPAGEATRIEYEHDKPGKYGTVRVYSVQSVRKKAGQLVLMENFLAGSAKEVREADFRPIESESYAQQTVLQTLQDWTKYHAWQVQQQGKK